MNRSRHDRWSRHAGVRWNPLALVIPVPAPDWHGPPIRHSGEGRNPGLAYGLQMTRKHLHQSAPRFSHLGVPAPAIGTKACPGLRSGMNRSRTTVGLVKPASVGIPSHSSFRPPNSSFRRRPESRVGVWVANDPQTPAPVSTSVFTPRRAGTSDWHESMSRTPIRDESFPPRPLVSSSRRPLESPRTRHSGPPIRHSGEGRNPGLAYGLQMTRKHLHQSAPRFSHLGVPAPAGTSDWHESMSRTPIRDESFPPRPLVSSSRPVGIPSHSSCRPPASSFRRRPESRGEGWRP